MGKVSVFESYIDAIYTLRNKCAHGAALFDLQLPNGISSKGPKLGLEGGNHQKLAGALTVLEYVLGQISENRKQDLQDDLNKLFSRMKRENKELTEILQKCSGIKF